MKKVLVCALAALLIMASCLTALAEGPSYVTTTTYVKDANEATKLQVETIVRGADEGTMLTYLAYKTSEPTDETIVYIDQQTADSNNEATFSYKTAEDNIAGVTVKYGSSVSNTASTEANVYNLRTITVNYDSSTYTFSLPTEVSSEVVKTVITDIVVPEFDSYEATINGDAAPAGVVTIDENSKKIVITDNAALVNNAVVVVTIEEKEVIPAPVVDDDAIQNNAFTGYEDSKPVEKLTVFGIADTTLDVAGDWGGIILTDDATIAETMTLETPGVEKYAAKYRGAEGQFAVQLVNKTETLELTNKPWYAKIYVKNAGSQVGYSEVISFNID